MKRQFRYPKHFEERKKLSKSTKKEFKWPVLGDFTGRLKNDLLNWFINASTLDNVARSNVGLF